MSKQIIIAEKHRIGAVSVQDKIQELVVATGHQQVGDIYLGTVENVLSGIDAAFVDIGDDKNGFIHVSDLGPLRLKKTSGAITELLSPKQSVLVQVMKEPTGSKGPRLTGEISLPGRFLVLMPYGKGVSLSRRITNENERNRLRALAVLIKPSGMGLLVRTEAEGKPEESILEDLEHLLKQWENVQQEVNSMKPPALLNRDDDFIKRVLRDMYSDDVERIVVDSDSAVKRVKRHLSNWEGGRSPQGVVIDYDPQYGSVLDHFRVNATIKEALKPRVDLPSGGYLIIEPTEALTVIDVNSGSFTESSTSRETVLWTNYEASIEIARQLRLRNLGGVIVVDFIDMDTLRDKTKVLEHFNDALRADKARPQIAQLSELGLVELTRKRQGKNIYELFSTPCPNCSGLGHLANLPGHNHKEVVAPVNTPIIVGKTVEKPTLVEEKPTVTVDRDDKDESEAVGYDSNNRRRRRRRDELELKDELPTLANNTNETEKKPERKDRSYLSRTSRRDESRYEKVVVEMNESEQDVYALMGVSPLVYLDQEFKDPKSILVLVKSAENGHRQYSNNSNNDHSDNKGMEEQVIESRSPLNEQLSTDDEQKEDKQDKWEDKPTENESLEDQANQEITEQLDNEDYPSVENFDTEPETIADAVIKETLDSDRPVVRTRRRRNSSSK